MATKQKLWSATVALTIPDDAYAVHGARRAVVTFRDHPDHERVEITGPKFRSARDQLFRVAELFGLSPVKHDISDGTGQTIESRWFIADADGAYVATVEVQTGAEL